MSNPLVDDPRILHVRYTDFIADPVATVRGYLRFLRSRVTPQAESAMRDLSRGTTAATATASSATRPNC